MMKPITGGILLLVLTTLDAFPVQPYRQDLADSARYKEVNTFFSENEACFVCHGESKYVLIDEYSGREITEYMCPNRMVLRSEYYESNHKSFACTDCHSDGFNTFPHSLEDRLETQYECIDCHGYDEHYAQYNFEVIQEEYLQSVHHEANPEFSCWKCHDPHSYKITVRNTENLEMTIAYDNDICLSCHADFDRFQLLTDREGINIINQHDWLPNQALHFRNVRCIECHTQVNDTVLVAHLLLPKEQAVQRCSECHSSNSLLMATLYKFQAKESRSEYGFLNSVVLNEGYVIGANRNYFLNVISIVLFGVTLLGIIIHATLRIIKKA